MVIYAYNLNKSYICFTTHNFISMCPKKFTFIYDFFLQRCLNMCFIKAKASVTVPHAQAKSISTKSHILSHILILSLK